MTGRRRSPAGALVVEGFSSRLAFGLLTFTVPLYAHDHGMSLGAVGALVSTTAAVSVVCKPLTGGLADRWGVRRSLLGSLVVRSLLCLGYLATAVPWQLFAVRAAHGLSDAVRDPSVHALLAVHGDKPRMATTFAWYQTAKSTAGSLGKGAAGLLLSFTAGYGAVFGAAFALSLVPVVLVALLIPPEVGRPRPSGVEPEVDDTDVVPEGVPVTATGPGVARFALLGFLVTGTSSLLTALFPVIATEYAGLSPAQAGAVYLLSPALALTGPAWGALADRVSRRLVLAVRSAANVLSALVLLVSPSLAGAVTSRGLDDLGKAAFRPAWGSLMAEVAGRRPAERARTMGYLTSGEDAGDLVAPVVAGLVWSAWGVPALLVLRIVVAVVTEAYAVGLERGQTRATHRRGPVVRVRLPRRGDAVTGSDAEDVTEPGWGVQMNSQRRT